MMDFRGYALIVEIGIEIIVLKKFLLASWREGGWTVMIGFLRNFLLETSTHLVLVSTVFCSLELIVRDCFWCFLEGLECFENI